MKKLLKQFHKSILDNDAAHALPALKPNNRLTPERQMAIYHDGYRLRLTQAIRDDYPALFALLGEAAFDKLALAYIESHPPLHFNLDRYPHGFSSFMERHLEDAFAIDLTMLEDAIAQVFMSPESEPLSASSLSDLEPEQFANLRLQPRLASRLLALRYPVDDWLLAQRNGNILPPPDPQGSYLYVYRHRNQVQRISLPEPAYRLLEQLFRNVPLGEALDAVGPACLQSWFADWLSKEFFRI